MDMYQANNSQSSVSPNQSSNNQTQYKYKINKHQYEFNTPNVANGLAEQIVDILVCSVLSSYDKKIT